MTIREFTIECYDEVLALWNRTPGICVRDADSRAGTERYLRRNPGLSFVVAVDGKIVGCAMSGHDGRRGYLQHVMVDPSCRRRGIALALVSRCLAELAREKIEKIHLDVLVTNRAAQAYWERRGWKLRDDIVRYSMVRSQKQNA